MGDPSCLGKYSVRTLVPAQRTSSPMHQQAWACVYVKHAQQTFPPCQGHRSVAILGPGVHMQAVSDDEDDNRPAQPPAKRQKRHRFQNLAERLSQVQSSWHLCVSV